MAKGRHSSLYAVSGDAFEVDGQASHIAAGLHIQAPSLPNTASLDPPAHQSLMLDESLEDQDMRQYLGAIAIEAAPPRSLTNHESWINFADDP